MLSTRTALRFVFRTSGSPKNTVFQLFLSNIPWCLRSPLDGFTLLSWWATGHSRSISGAYLFLNNERIRNLGMPAADQLASL